jgi:hypothetical protein
LSFTAETILLPQKFPSPRTNKSSVSNIICTKKDWHYFPHQQNCKSLWYLEILIYTVPHWKTLSSQWS